MTERDRLDLRGLLPPNVMSSDQQIERFSKFLSPSDFICQLIKQLLFVFLFLPICMAFLFDRR